jgi:hypothetical protein
MISRMSDHLYDTMNYFVNEVVGGKDKLISNLESNDSSTSPGSVGRHEWKLCNSSDSDESCIE